MATNIFEGARRIALLIAGTATVGTLIGVFIQDPYMTVSYSITYPTGPFTRMEEPCPSEAGKHYFTSKTSTGKEVSIVLCLLPSSFGEDGKQLIPYKVDEKGMTWGASSYSSEVSAYERRLEAQFKIPPSDEKSITKEISRRYLENIVSTLGYLVGGLVFFGGLVWAIGWIVRGFLGIPWGMDRRPE